ncbi:carbohydrate-binding protein [Glaciecola sp. MH2013]|uniref:carbohydrate-binding protein n=1 Tax=Glaciecola sp. MH2013 TaxID=2785524 RepID=UPI0018A01044|nr:carbohydrate-binding protein [Glaciecola sp. MH2013]MBF7074568.1 carbohydrate-binding protein [Glaciecola sp. MH2013]
MAKLHNIRALKHLLISIYLMVVAVSGSAFAQSPNNQLRGGEIQSFDEYKYGKVEVRMYSQRVTGTTSTFFWWREGGHRCGTKWNEIDIETIPVDGKYQSNPIWQTSDDDCDIKRSEALHGDADLYDRWVTYTLEWTPDSITWYHDGIRDRRITRDNHPSINHIQEFMRYCFNLWTQGNANPDWLGNLDFNKLRSTPVYQFVDYFRYYAWNGSGFNNNPTKTINFSSQSDIDNNFAVSSWEFSESKGFLSWSPDAVGVVDIGGGNGALWLGLFHEGDERAPNSSEIPGGSSGSNAGQNGSITIEAESAINSNGLRIRPNNLGYISNGSWATYSAVNIPSAGEYDITYRASSGGNGGTIQLERAGGSAVFGSVDIPATGSWSTFRETTHTVNLPAGNLSFGMYFADGGFNLDKFTIKAKSLSPVGATRLVEAESAIGSSGLRIAARNLGYITNGAWASYSAINIGTAGQYRVTYRVSSGGDGGSIQLEQAGGARVFGEVAVPATGAWSNYTTVSHIVTLPRGNLQFGMYFADGGFNLDHFSIVRMQ